MRLRIELDTGSRSYHRAWVIDWSPLGARITSHAPLRAGQSFQAAETEESRAFVRCRVAWASSPQADESRQFGIEFLPREAGAA